MRRTCWLIRGDLHAALASIVPAEIVRLDHGLVGLDRTAGGVRLSFANGASVDADAVIGADGVNSVVRTSLFGEAAPRFTGRIAYRTVYPAERLDGFDIGDCTKWWGQDRHIVMYPAAILSRCLRCVDRDGVAAAFRRYEATSQPRTARMQLTSRTNTWGKGVTDTDWVYGYDAWTAPLTS